MVAIVDVFVLVDVILVLLLVVVVVDYYLDRKKSDILFTESKFECC